MSRGFGELCLGAASALLWFLCGGEGACPICTPRLLLGGETEAGGTGSCSLGVPEDWEGSREAVRVLLKGFACRRQSAPLGLVFVLP